MDIWHSVLAAAAVNVAVLASVFGLNHKFAPRTDAVALTIMLVILTCAEWAIFFIPGPPDPTWLLAGLDTIGALGAWVCWRSRRRAWKEVLTFTFVAAILLQVCRGVAEVAAPATFGPHTQGGEMFTFARNVLFFAQSACCAWVGGSRAYALLLDRVSHGGASRHHLGAGR